MTRADKIPVAVLGATGSVGQRFVSLLSAHPWFELVAVTASERSVGRPYGDAVRWLLPQPVPAEIAAMTVGETRPPLDCPLIFSALDASVAGPIESDFAGRGHLVVSNAKSHRMDPDVPLIVPEVNPDHLELASRQQFGGGAIITNPNCSTIGLVLALKPLHDAFGLEKVHVVTMQALSGAGYPGVSSLEITDNVIPFIAGEEEKMEHETLKILGTLGVGGIDAVPIRVSAHCNRVAVSDGHTECVSVSLREHATASEICRAWREFSAEPQARGLPSAPRKPVRYLQGVADPQPRLHRDLDGGMAVAVGRLRVSNLFDISFVALSHNTIRGRRGDRCWQPSWPFRVESWRV